MIIGFTCASVNQISANEDISLFEKYITKCFNDSQNLMVSENGIDATEEFLNNYSEEYLSGNLDSIREYINQENVDICYVETVNKERKTDSVAKIYQFYKAATDSTGTFTKEWLISLQCYITWDGNTYRITSVNTPLLYISNASWGSNWSPYLTNVGTNYSINANRTAVTFSGNYTMMGCYTIRTGITKTYNFGSYYVTQTFTV
ncbi:MAG: hypothetical protein Q4C49_13455 [Bacillota bacterium]|nr:hypothetical protein [Bacillota bacterium]